MSSPTHFRKRYLNGFFSYLAKPEKTSWPGPPFQMFRFIESPQLEVFEGISTTFPHRCWLDCSNDCNCWCCCTYTHYVLHTWYSKSSIIRMIKVQKKFLLSFFLTLSFYCVFFYTSSQVRCIFQYIHSWMYFFSNFLHF